MNGVTANAIPIAATMRWIAVDTDNIPPTLRDLPRWVIWQGALRNGKVTKIPHRGDAPTETASTTAQGSWTDLATAMNVHAQGKADGVGIVLTGDGRPS